MEALPVMSTSAQVSNNTRSISKEVHSFALKDEFYSLDPFLAIVFTEGVK